MEEDPLEVLTPCGMVEIPDPPRVALGALTPEALDLRVLLEGTEVDVDGRHPALAYLMCLRTSIQVLTKNNPKRWQHTHQGFPEQETPKVLRLKICLQAMQSQQVQSTKEPKASTTILEHLFTAKDMTEKVLRPPNTYPSPIRLYKSRQRLTSLILSAQG